MAVEIERKFLVVGDEWRSQTSGTVYRQGYIAATPGRTVRVRVAGDNGYLTIKGATSQISRAEFEYPIPLSDAEEMLQTLCDRPLIEKTRYRLDLGDVTWEIDEFFGENAGLIIAEVELTSEDQVIDLPSWVGQEVSGDRRYYNASLSIHPFSKWQT